MGLRFGKRAAQGVLTGCCFLAVALSGGQGFAATFGYVANVNDNTVSVIDTSTNTSVATILVGLQPISIAVTPDGAHVYVLNGGDNTVSVIATATNAVVGSAIPVGPSFGSENGNIWSGALAVSPNGNNVYVTNTGGNNVSVIATATNTVVDTIPVGSLPTGIAITPDGSHVYVTNVGDGTTDSSTVSVIATATNAVEGLPITVGSFALGVAISPDGTHAYVADLLDGGIDVIATATNTVVATIPVDAANTVAISPDGSHAYTLSTNTPNDNHVDETVSVIDTATNTVVTSIDVGPAIPIALYTIGVTPDGTAVYVPVPKFDPNTFSPIPGTATVIATASDTVVGAAPVGIGPFAIAFPPTLSAPASGTACNGAYSGTFKGNITVSAGQNCAFNGGGVTGNVSVKGGHLILNNATITGNMTIQGAAFSINGASISGNVAIQNVASGATANQVCNASIKGNLNVNTNAVPVNIGSTGNSCLGNKVGGNLGITFNTGPVQVFDNSIGMNLSCTNNSSITGAGNVASKKVGQCSAF